MNMPESESIGAGALPRVVPADHVQPAPERPGRSGAVRRADARPVEPVPRPADGAQHGAGRARRSTRRFVAEGKPGATNRSLASYQNWWNGGVRSTACFHNQIGILSEISGSPTPIEIAFVPKNLVATNDNPFPVQPQAWHFRQAIDYLLTANRAILDIASEHREHFLLQHLPDGQERDRQGEPRHVDVHGHEGLAECRRRWRGTTCSRGRGGAPIKYAAALRDPALRDARGYVLPSDQPDFLTATKFVNALIKNGVTVHRATAAFQVGEQELPGRLLRREDRAGVPAARARQLRAAGLSGRFRLSGRAAGPPVRRDRLHAGLPDGSAVRPHPRRVRRPVREDRGDGPPAARAGSPEPAGPPDTS